MKDHIKKNWRKYALTLAGAGAAYYGGPAGRDAVYEYLPRLCAAVGLC